MSNKIKKTRDTHTHSISNELYAKFMAIVEDKSLNKSKIIEKLIQKWVEDNSNEKK